MRGREAILERLDGTRTFVIPNPTPLRDASGTIVAAINMTVDISELKAAERTLGERNTQLALAGQAGLVGSYAFYIKTGRLQISAGYAAIFGLPEGAVDIVREDWQARVHPDDLARLNANRNQAFVERRCQHQAEYRIVRSAGDVRSIESRSSISYDTNGRAERMIGAIIDITERKQADERQNLLIGELDHRVKNVLARVAVVARYTRESCGSMDEMVVALDGRIKSMATAHTLLSRGRWRGVRIVDLVRDQLAPHARANNTTLDGSHVALTAESAEIVAMVIHELVTNAAKYGALSTSQGHVLVRWDQQVNGSSSGNLVVDWLETGGPSVLAPAQPGFGLSVIRDIVPFELGGGVDLNFASGGVQCRIEIPLKWMSEINSSVISNGAGPAATLAATLPTVPLR